MVPGMSNQPIRAVLLDYGGVIAEEGFRGELVAMAREQGLDPHAVLQVAKYAVYDSGFVLGTGTEEAFWTAMREGSGLQGSDAEMTARVLDAFILRPWVIEWVHKWHEQGYITGILSDQMHWLDWLNERDRFFDAFDHVFNSFHMGKGKRDPTLFDDIAEQLALPPAGILFVDVSFSSAHLTFLYQKCLVLDILHILFQNMQPFSWKCNRTSDCCFVVCGRCASGSEYLKAQCSDFTSPSRIDPECTSAGSQRGRYRAGKKKSPGSCSEA